MDRIEQHLKDKYYDSDFDKFIKLNNKYLKIKSKIKKPYYYTVSTFLCWRYPFLKFRIDKGFIQKSCYWWCIPDGWRKAFGFTMCEELRGVLKRLGWLHKYQISDVKEKFGELTIYDDGAPEEVHDIIMKYGYISRRTCIICGRRAKYLTEGWVEPYCEDCIKGIDTIKPPYEYHKDIEWYGWKKC